MSYTQKLTTFTKGNQLSNCGKYNLEDLDDMFCDTQFSNNEDKFLEDVLTESKSFNGKFDLSSTVTVMEELDDDEMNMYIVLDEYNELLPDDEVECSYALDYEAYYQSI